jgi:RNA polymerase sigma factor (sigma-70 family)
MDQDADRVTWAHDVAQAIDELAPAQGSVVRMTYFEHLSQERIAERLSVSVRDVRATLAAGMRQLTALLGLTPSP